MLAVGAMLQGRYKITEPLSEGGMSIVYLAEDAVLGNRVAIKEMKVHFLSANERALAADQFLKEARILASLEHAGLPRVTNFFEQDSRHYLVMDYIAGDTFETLVNQSGGSLPEDMVLRVADGVARVLDYLHNVKPAVIFRDLKPSNIMLLRAAHGAEDERDRLKLIDFGISKFFDSAQGTHTIIKGAGTPGYAPPEQYGSQGRMRTDPRSDLYSLGATMYSLLTGTIPAEATDRWMNGEILTPPRQLNALVSVETEALVLQLLELKPEARPSTAREVIDRIDGLLAARTRNASSSGNLQRPARRFRSSITGAAADDGTGPQEMASAPNPTVEPSASTSTVEASTSPPTSESSGQPPPAPVPSAPAPVPVASSPEPAPSTPAPVPVALQPSPQAQPEDLSQRPLPRSQNPTVLGAGKSQARSPVIPALVVIALLGLSTAALSAFEIWPFTSRVPKIAGGSPSPTASVASSSAPASPAVSPSSLPSPALAPTRLGVEVSPTGGKVFLDGGAAVEASSGCLWLTVSPGPHTLKVRKQGYLTRIVTAEARAQTDVKLAVTLVKEATLRINATPLGAKVVVDEKEIGRVPVTLRSLAEGNHRYKVFAPDHVAETGTIKLKAGQEARLDFHLDPVGGARVPNGSLDVPTVPQRVPTYEPPPYRPPVVRPPVSVPQRPVPEPRATSVDIPAPRATPR